MLIKESLSVNETPTVSGGGSYSKGIFDITHPLIINIIIADFL